MAKMDPTTYQYIMNLAEEWKVRDAELKSKKTEEPVPFTPTKVFIGRFVDPPSTLNDASYMHARIAAITKKFADMAIVNKMLSACALQLEIYLEKFADDLLLGRPVDVSNEVRVAWLLGMTVAQKDMVITTLKARKYRVSPIPLEVLDASAEVRFTWVSL